MNKLSGLKDMLWAIFIFLALVFAAFALIFSMFKKTGGEIYRPSVSFGTQKEQVKDNGSGKASEGQMVPGQLNELEKTKDAGGSYAESLYYLADNRMIGLYDYAGLSPHVWVGEYGVLDMSTLPNWTVRLPSDGSFISPATAAMVAKPEILVLCIGSDSLDKCSQDSFVSGYVNLIEGILASSPKTRIICCSIPHISSLYSGSMLTNDMIDSANGWLELVCTRTGAFYADINSVLEKNGQLKSEYCTVNGSSLNDAGVEALLDYLRKHALS